MNCMLLKLRYNPQSDKQRSQLSQTFRFPVFADNYLETVTVN